VDSFLIIPSTSYLIGDLKREEREKYKSTVSGIPCKNYNYGKGKCVFGTSCMYQHISEDGIRSAPIGDFKVIQGVDGKKTKKETQLSDYIRYR